MKKLLLAATFSLLSIFGLNAQTSTYYPMLVDSNSWAVYGDVIPLLQPHNNPTVQWQNGSGYINWVKDTIVDSVEYKMFYSRDHEWVTGQWSLLREDTATQRVYIWSAGDSAERIIYDYSLVQGDSIWLDFMYVTAGTLQSGWWYVDSVSTYLIDAGPRKAIYLSNPDNPLHWGQPRFIQWIESVGCNVSPLYLDETTTDNMSGYDQYMPAGCTQNSHFYSTVCAWHNGTRTWFSDCWQGWLQNPNWMYGFTNGDSCVFNLYGGVIDPISGISSLQLMPNPAGGITTLEFENATALEFEITITNVLGQEMKSVAPYSWYAKGSHTVEINLNGLAPGMYNVNMIGAYGVKTTLLVVE